MLIEYKSMLVQSHVAFQEEGLGIYTADTFA